MNGRIYDPLIGRFMSADPFIDNPGDLQNYNRYAYVRNNPLAISDPSGYGWWTSIRSIVVRAVAAVADVAFGCSGYCSAAVGAYEGSKNGGGLTGAIVGGITGYVGYQVSLNYPLTNIGGGINWGNVATASAINSVGGCASAAASGGNCGRGALSGAVGTVGAAYGFYGSVIAGCVTGKVSGDGCSQGAINAVGSMAIHYLVRQGYESMRPQPVVLAFNTTDRGEVGPGRTPIPSPFDLRPIGQLMYNVLDTLYGGLEWAWTLTVNAVTSSPPAIPDKLVGDQSDPRAGPNKNGGKHTSGPLTPDNGGTGQFRPDLDKLTGGVRPWQPGDKAPPGSLVGPNGIFGRPGNSSGGQSIDIPANGSKPHETLHYP